MAYDEALAERVRAALAELEPREQKMFGGIAWMVEGRMVAGVIADELLARVGAGGQADALARGARRLEMGARTMRGFVLVAQDQLDDATLGEWLELGLAVARSSQSAQSS